jgi:hypothetical protein
MAIPESLRQSAMIKVMNDPSLFVQLTKELKDGQPINYYGALLGALKKAGLIAGSITLKQLIPVLKQDEDEGKPDFSDFIKQKLRIEKNIIPPDIASVDLPQEGSPTTQVASRLNRGVKTPIAANVGTAPPAASIDRNRFASLFPNDPISGLINTQQQSNTQFMRYGGVAGDPSYDMGLETDVTAQQAIQSALEKTGSDDNTTQQNLGLPSTFKKAKTTRPTGITSINIPGYANTIVNELRDFVTKYKPSISVPEGGGIQFGITKSFEDGGFVDAGAGGDEDDYISDAFSQSDFNQFGGQDNIDFGNYADETKAMQDARAIVEPRVGVRRSNIGDEKGYDPVYAQALNITRGLLPGNQGQGIENLARPPSLTPQIPGDLDMRAGYGYERPMFFSRGEQVFQQYLPGIVEQAMDMGIMGLARKAGDYFSGNFSKLFGNQEVTPQKIKMEDLKYTNPIQTKGIKQIPLNEYMFSKAGMRPRFDINLLDPAFEVKDFQPGGAFDQRENLRIEVLPDGRQVVTSLGNV